MHNPSHLAMTTDGGVVLDLKNDRLLKLNSIGTEMWTLLTRGMSETQVVGEIAERYGVDPSKVRKDLRNLLSRAEEFGVSPESVLITERTEHLASDVVDKHPAAWEQDQAPNAVSTTRDVVKAISGLALFDIILSCGTLETLCSVVTSWPIKASPPASDATAVAQVSRAVERACVWYPKKALCLQRSAVTTCLLRQRGIHAHMVVGVRAMPFLAHAWVEVHGRVVNDFPRVKTFYQSLSSY